MLFQFVCGDKFMNCECLPENVRSKAKEFVAKKIGSCKRGSGEKVDVVVKHYTIGSEEELQTAPYMNLVVDLPERELTKEDYDSEMVNILKCIPVQFHAFVESYAYELGHSSGYSSVLDYANEIVSRMEDSIESYRKEILSQPKSEKKSVALQNIVDAIPAKKWKRDTR